jgi:hypothetical protein
VRNRPRNWYPLADLRGVISPNPVSGQPTDGRSTGKLPGSGEFESLPWRKRDDANRNKTGPTKTRRSATGSLLTSAKDGPKAKPPEKLQDAGKGDCSGCGCGFRLRTNAENSVMTSPIGKG